MRFDAARRATDEGGGANTACLRRLFVERSAEGQLNLAVTARERESFGLVRIDQERHDADGHRLVALAVLFELGTGREHLDVGENDF